MILGQALAKQGQRTEGLKEFAKGLEIMFPGGSSKELALMIKEHPAFMQPTAPRRPNPFMAEQFYGKGLHDYWAGKFDDAEKQFETALGYFKDDARFFYYFGLTCLQQGKRAEATEAFQKANELESKSRPSSAQINAMLERVQGTARQAIDQAREHPQVEAGN